MSVRHHSMARPVAAKEATAGSLERYCRYILNTYSRRTDKLLSFCLGLVEILTNPRYKCLQFHETFKDALDFG